MLWAQSLKARSLSWTWMQALLLVLLFEIRIYRGQQCDDMRHSSRKPTVRGCGSDVAVYNGRWPIDIPTILHLGIGFKAKNTGQNIGRGPRGRSSQTLPIEVGFRGHQIGLYRRS
ncbi:hypothetical protein F5Y16DRAFT_380449 [Xylariaceae sp. FL0255]|nr:hypothetical protein F5Y16DRAFT_380449 [Xylariaceae sp. FL0255]